MTSLCIKLSQFRHKEDSIYLTISGQEPELAEFHKRVFLEADTLQQGPKLTGTFTVLRITDDYFSLTGCYSYSFSLPCSHCNQATPLQIEEEINQGASPRKQSDELYLIKNKEIKLTDIIEESLLLALPTTTTCSACSSENEGSEESCIYRDESQTVSSLEAAFASFSLPEKN